MVKKKQSKSLKFQKLTYQFIRLLNRNIIQFAKNLTYALCSRNQKKKEFDRDLKLNVAIHYPKIKLHQSKTSQIKNRKSKTFNSGI